MFFRGLELSGAGALQMLVAGIEMDVGAVGQFFRGTADHLLEVRLGLVELVFLHGTQSCFVALQGLRVARIVRHRLLRGCFLGHVQNSSCALWNGNSLRTGLPAESKVSLKEWVEGNSVDPVASGQLPVASNNTTKRPRVEIQCQ